LTEKRKILRSAWVISIFTIASRICGYLRDQRITLLLGTSGIADSFILAFRIPNLLRRLVGEGSLAACFIPVFSGYIAHKSKEEAWAFANRIFWTAAVLLAAVALLGSVFSRQAVYLFTIFGRSSAQWDQAVFLNRIMFPYAFFIGIAALAMAILNSLNVFGLPASTSVLFNLSVILFSFAAVYRPVMKWAPERYRNPAVALAAGVLLGGALQMLVQLPALFRRGMRFTFSVSFTDPGVRRVAALMIPGLVGVGIFQINFFVDTIFATSSRMPGGSVIALYVADRVMELVLGGYAIAVATAILPLMSRQASVKDLPGLKETLAFAVRIVSFITIPAALGLMVLRGPIISVLFEHGRFSSESTQLTARALLYYAAGLPAFAGVKLIVPAFYSQQDMRTPVVAAAGALAANVMLNVLFLRLLFEQLRNGSPALASSLACYFNFFLLFFILRARVGGLGARRVFASLVKVGISSLVMGAACYAMLHFLRDDWGRPFGIRVAELSAAIGGAIAVFLGASWVQRCEEIHEVMDILRHRRTEPEVQMLLQG
jgi:putative peptidoglycan lipid II flippase